MSDSSSSGGSARRWIIIVIIVAMLAMSAVFRQPLAHIQLPGEPLFTVGGIIVTNTMLTAYLVSIVLLLFAFFATRNLKLVPSGAQNLLEVAIETLLNLVEGVSGRTMGRKFFPLVATIFLFILTANYMGLLPGFGTIGIWEAERDETVFVPLFRSASTDLNVTVALALIAIAMVQFFGIRTVGFGTYTSRFINFKSPLDFFMGILEIISELSRVISLSFRLFGNVFAGEVLLAVIGFLVPFVAVLPFYGLELFVGAVQAFIFALLTLIFLTLAVMEHGGEAHANH
ncbi:MAG: F0F1 ATP synthase subunit A [Chloroflexota bacterium]